MNSRYVTSVLLALFGGIVLVASQSFLQSVAGWIGSAFGTAVIAVSLLAQVDRSRGLVLRAMDGVMVALGVLPSASALPPRVRQGGGQSSPSRWGEWPFRSRVSPCTRSPSGESNEGLGSCTGFPRSSLHR